MQNSDVCSKLVNYGKNHFSSLKNCQSWDHHAGIICSFFKHQLGHGEAPGKEHQFPAQPSGKRARSRLSQHPLIPLGMKGKTLKMLKMTSLCVSRSCRCKEPSNLLTHGDKTAEACVLRRLGVLLHRIRIMHFFNTLCVVSKALSRQVLLCVRCRRHSYGHRGSAAPCFHSPRCHSGSFL